MSHLVSEMNTVRLVVVGNTVSPRSLKHLDAFQGFVAVENGIIVDSGNIEKFEQLTKLGRFERFETIVLTRSQFLMPGFVDCHTHASQFPNLGIGLDKKLIEWLHIYTFPLESRFEDVKFASRVYDSVVQRLLNNGTTTACFFGTLHLNGTLELAKSAIRLRQRALVGKVSQNIGSDDGYNNNVEKELIDTEEFVKKVLELNSELVLPILTPRSALCCDVDVMRGLSKIARKYRLRIQSHISESMEQVQQVLRNNPSCSSFAEVYVDGQILTNKCILAHAVYLTKEETTILAERGVSIAHCPSSNTRLKSGLCPVRRYLDQNINVGLGTDVSAGDHVSILDVMRRAIDVSIHLELQGNEGYSISWIEALYMATLGGAKSLHLDHKTGNFEIGKEFDALLVDVYSEGDTEDLQDPQYNEIEFSLLDLIQRFVYFGDERNILQVYVKGKRVKDELSTVYNNYNTKETSFAYS